MGGCPICGRPLGRNKNACSQTCYSELRQNYKTCVVCGEKFADSLSNPTVTCSPECSSENRRRLHASGTYNDATKAMIEVRLNHPLLGQYETHINAKTWVIQAPDGNVYRCRNLKLWLREHEEMIDGTVQQAWDGITKIKYSMQGKRKDKSHQWKGWRLIEWGE